MWLPKFSLHPPAVSLQQTNSGEGGEAPFEEYGIASEVFVK